jgi:hypothetical protein
MVFASRGLAPLDCVSTVLDYTRHTRFALVHSTKFPHFELRETKCVPAADPVGYVAGPLLIGVALLPAHASYLRVAPVACSTSKTPSLNTSISPRNRSDDVVAAGDPTALAETVANAYPSQRRRGDARGSESCKRAAVKTLNVLSAAATPNARPEKRYWKRFDRLDTRSRAQFRRRVAPTAQSSPPLHGRRNPPRGLLRPSA